MKLGEFIIRMRQGKGWTVDKLAQRCEAHSDECPTVIREDQIRLIEAGGSEVDPAELHNLATALGIRPRWLYDLAGSDPTLDPDQAAA